MARLPERFQADWKYPAWRRELAHSFGVIASKMVPSAAHGASTERIAFLRRMDLSLANTCLGGGRLSIAFELNNSGDRKGMAYVAGKLGLDIEVAFNLQVGLWNAKPEDLAGVFYGVEVNLDLEVGVSLGIYMTPTLGTYGFSVGVGVGVGGGATVVGGYTWIF